jgi:hypothetical protein
MHLCNHFGPRGSGDPRFLAEARSIEAAITDERVVGFDDDVKTINFSN